MPQPERKEPRDPQIEQPNRPRPEDPDYRPERELPERENPAHDPERGGGSEME
jgi:hypothetical protein